LSSPNQIIKDVYLKRASLNPSPILPLRVGICIWDSTPDFVAVYYQGENESYSIGTLKDSIEKNSWKHEVLKEYFPELSEPRRENYSGLSADILITNPEDREFIFLLCSLKDDDFPIWKEIFKMIVRKENKEEIINTLTSFMISTIIKGE